jgi:hypothetical protein
MPAATTGDEGLVSGGADRHRIPLRLSPAAWFCVTLATFWIALLGHEGAHFWAAHFAYSPINLSTGHVSPDAQLFVVGAGPTFTIVTTIACAFAVVRWHEARAVGIAAIAFAVSRLLIIAPGTLLGAAVNDERTVAALSGVPAGLLWAVEALVAAAAVALVARATPFAERSRSLVWIGAGIVIGWVSALTIGRAIGLPI